MSYQLESCVWEITLGCCFSCRYCGSKGGKATENELTTSECLSVANQLVELGCKRVSLIGGEVFMREDWIEIVKALTSNKIKVCIITNGFLFSENIISTLKDCHIESVAVSIDGPEQVHDKYRQSGSYQRAMRAIEVLTENSIPVSVISTLNKENVRYLSPFYDTLVNYPIFAWQLQACSPMGNAANGGIDIDFDFGEVIDFVKSKMYDAPFMMGIADNIGYYTEDEGYLRGNLSGKGFFRGCRAGLTNIGIDSVGNVKGCESLYDDRFIEGNLRNQSLKEIWNNPENFAYNRKFSYDMLTGKCKSCNKKERCAAGCRSYNYFVHHNMYENPRCAKKD